MSSPCTRRPSGTGLELTVGNPPIRDYLLSEGSAWAASSYRANGYVPGVGAKGSHALIGEFSGAHRQS